LDIGKKEKFMAKVEPKMKLWNGSEFHLLRYLGRHRNELNKAILRNTNLNPDLDYDMDWIDYGFWDSTVFDAESRGINFLGNPKIYDKVAKEWIKYWPQTGNCQNWDAVIHLTPLVPKSKKIEKWVIVEAKAHLEELKSTSGAGQKSKIIIENAFKETKDFFGINTENNWLEEYYQLANRLAFIHFMQKNNIDVSLLNIYFINGWPDDKKINVPNKNMWDKKIKEEYNYLGINQRAKNYISNLFINCKYAPLKHNWHFSGSEEDPKKYL
jgi:hypothetical protein